MATTSTHVICAVCTKGKGTFKCEGCLQIFCSKHSIDHRHELTQKLEEIVLTRDVIYQTFTEQSQQHLLINRIDQWEQKAIVKIHQTAEELKNKVAEETFNLEQTLKNITDQLRQAHEDDDFIEIDLDQWTQKLDELEKKLINIKTLFVQGKKIRIENEDAPDIFQYVCGDVQIKDGGYLIKKDDWIGFSEVLGKREYVTGQHTIQFKIEELRRKGWLLFGIISKSEPMNINSCTSLSSYGWSTYDQIYIAGQWQKGQGNDIVSNDMITLMIDCDQRKIQMKNDRMGHFVELSIDINKCPFPWKLHFNLLTASISIRILPTLK